MTDNTKKEKSLSLLKELFALSKRISFLDVTLKDGSILRTEDAVLNKGSKVILIGTDGAESTAPEGDITTADGAVLTIKSGVVDNIGTAPAPAEEKMEAPMATYAAPTTPVPATPEGDNSAEDVNGMDPAMLMETIKNLIDRVAALEDSSASTNMAVEKMSESPAAKPFNFDPFKEGSIGFELEKFKSERKAKEAGRKEIMEKFSTKKVSPKMEFNAPIAPTNVIHHGKPITDLGLSGFEITN